MEKRSNERHNCEASFICNYFNKEKSHKARVLNYSESGVYIECDGFFKCGATVLLRMERFVSGDSDAEVCCSLGTVSLGQVKWCKEMADRDSPYFALGLKYLCATYY
jgi:hypothetical protein